MFFNTKKGTMEMKNEIYKKYIKPILKRVKKGIATPDEIAIIPELLKVAAEHYLP